MSDYRGSMAFYDANRFQPDCCASLVISWLVAMKNGEASCEGWCAKAAQHDEASDFYATHKAQNDKIEGVSRLNEVNALRNDAIRRGAEAKDDFTTGKIDKQAAEQVVTQVTADILKLNPELASLKAQKPRSDALSLLGFSIAWEQTDNLDKNLKDCMGRTGTDMRCYILSVKAKAGSHAIGLVNTKSDGMMWGTNGYLYYYDPNLKKVVRFDSRHDCITFFDKVKGDYSGLTKLTALKIAPTI
jgi:hypothetical protein